MKGYKTEQKVFSSQRLRQWGNYLQSVNVFTTSQSSLHDIFIIYSNCFVFKKNSPNPVVWDFINSKYEQLNNYIEGHYYHTK